MNLFLFKNKAYCHKIEKVEHSSQVFDSIKKTPQKIVQLAIFVKCVVKVHQMNFQVIEIESGTTK